MKPVDGLISSVKALLKIFAVIVGPLLSFLVSWQVCTKFRNTLHQAFTSGSNSQRTTMKKLDGSWERQLSPVCDTGLAVTLSVCLFDPSRIVYESLLKLG